VRELGSRRVLWGQFTAARREHYRFPLLLLGLKGWGFVFGFSKGDGCGFGNPSGRVHAGGMPEVAAAAA
jgi:hypothetical protein